MEDHHGFMVTIVTPNGTILENQFWGTLETAEEEQAFLAKCLMRGIIQTPTGTGSKVIIAKIISSK